LNFGIDVFCHVQRAFLCVSPPLKTTVIPAQAGIQGFDFVWFLVLKAVDKK
jgi:hypothetical protein